MIKEMFLQSKASWIKYDKYEWRADKSGEIYLMPGKKAKPEYYDPIKCSDEIVLRALAIGKLCMLKNPDEEIQPLILQFAHDFGLFGIMTSLPTTANFVDYTAVYLPQNNIIKQESMEVLEYLDLFFPFEKLEIRQRGTEVNWNVGGDNDMVALLMSTSGYPMAVSMCWHRSYAERFLWLKKQFRSLFFTFISSTLYYTDKDDMEPSQQEAFRRSIYAFSEVAPTYRLALLDKPTLIWDFHSLILSIRMMFVFMLTDDKKPVRMCKHCSEIFIANRTDAVFCSPKCKNRFNVYKSRSKNKSDGD